MVARHIEITTTQCLRPIGKKWQATALAGLLSVALMLIANSEACGSPYQLLESPAAILVRDGGQEIKVDYGTEADQIPTETLLVHYRYGVKRWMELSGGLVYARFLDQDIERLAELQATAKFQLPLTWFGATYVAYTRWRESLDDPIVVDIDRRSDDVKGAVSRHADGGRDASVGILARKRVRPFSYTLGLEYLYAGNRNFGDFEEDQVNVYTVYFTPERHFFRNSLMLALENRYTVWQNRGDFYDAIPQARWEFIKNWVVETGVSVPVIGGRTYRYILGITFQY